MINKKQLLILLSIGMAVFFYACSEFPGFKKTKDGMKYKFYVKGNDTTTMRTGMILTMKLKYAIDDSTLFNSDDMEESFKLPLELPSYKGDIYTALTMMKPGDSATFISSADSFFLKTVQLPQVPDSAWIGKNIHFHIKLLSAMTSEQMQAEQQAEMETLRIEEMAKLEAYIDSGKIAVSPLESGLYFIEEVKGTGKKPKETDIVKVHFKVSDITGRVFFSSYDQGEPMRWEAGKVFDNAGATEALNLMSVGSKVKAIVPSSIGFGEQGRGNFVAPYSTLIYDLEMMSFQTKAQFDKERENEQRKAEGEKEKNKAQEMSKLANYVKSNNITVKPTASGLYYIETLAGSGEKPVAGKKVQVHYTGTLLDGTKFDSSVDRGQPFEFVLGQGQVIQGWDEGIAMMKKGGKARLIIPSAIAYGPDGRMPTIPQSATLIFDVELIDFE
ncbi:MAG: FKBP-type peptidyl-prolyl cis-trans isomerase [Lentimicrobium sp.]|nr:FKBP-type peptidyl-prolyl cis-trans isomerase [Lentimicrobium sp.]